MGRLAGFTYRKIVQKLKTAGFRFKRQAKGAHEIWFNPETRRLTVVPRHPGEFSETLVRSIIRQAGLSVDEFLSL